MDNEESITTMENEESITTMENKEQNESQDRVEERAAATDPPKQLSRTERRRLERKAAKEAKRSASHAPPSEAKRSTSHVLPSEFYNAAADAMRASRASNAGSTSLVDALSHASALTETLTDTSALDDMSEADATRVMFRELLGMIPNKNVMIPVGPMLKRLEDAKMPAKSLMRLRESIGGAKTITGKQFKKYITRAMTGK